MQCVLRNKKRKTRVYSEIRTPSILENVSAAINQQN